MKPRGKKQKQPVWDREVDVKFQPRAVRFHVAQEYRERLQPEVGRELVSGLREWAKDLALGIK